jgi:CHAT domain-containing protein/tetratricopeptide (TPR) repeat protein
MRTRATQAQRAGLAFNYIQPLRLRLFQTFCTAWVLCVCGCMGGFDSEPLVEYSTELNVEGTRPQTVSRQLRAGVYLLEIRERDIDLRVKVDAGSLHTELADAYLRHGLHRLVVSLEQPAAVRLTLSSVDQRSWHGAAALRILRWPAAAGDARPDERLLGFKALGRGNELVARDNTKSWRASIAPLREAAAHFRAANDQQSLAEAEYQRGWVEFNDLHDFESGRRTAEDAVAHFKAAGDQVGMQRASMLLGLQEFNLASQMSPDVPRSEQRALLDRAAERMDKAQKFFSARDMETDAMYATLLACIRESILGQSDLNAPLYEKLRARARTRGDKFFEAAATHNLAYIAQHRGDVVTAAAMYGELLPLIERNRNPDLYASILSNLGYSLIALGEFDRALVLHTEALELFSARGDDSQTARELAALAAIQFRSGNVERALATIESALPLYERSLDQDGHVSALRLAGNAAAELGQHDLALSYLRNAEKRDKNGITIDRTRVLIAGELRTLGDLNGAERMLADVVGANDESTRADAIAERARLRRRQHRDAEALSDLRLADAIYERLKLDFDRIDTSSALALALLDAGDVKGAARAADTAVAIETRIRVKAANPEMRARFLSASYAPYEARIEVDLAGASPKDADAIWKSFRTAETIRARSLTDRLAHAEHAGVVPHDEQIDRLREQMTALQIDLERRTRKPNVSPDALLELRRQIDETRARLEARSLGRGAQSDSTLAISETRTEVQAALPQDTAVLAYFVGDIRSHGWLLSRTELRHVTLPGRRVLQGLVKDFVQRQRSRLKSPADEVFAPLLGNLLIGVNARRLLILPDGPLNGLPFAALPLPHGQPHELLIDRFVITAAPSLALAMRPSAPRMPQQTRVVVISDPVYTPDDRRLMVASRDLVTYRGAEPATVGLARLPYSAIEARAVVRAFEGANVIELTGFNATARHVIELPSQDLDVLHFATHAVARKDAPEQSALFLSEYAADGSPLSADRLTADDIARSGLRADVVVLSGCATGDGRELRGEGVLGLTYGFLANGSHTVIASLWPVEDALTARFMEEFYAAYRVSGRAADALRVAQLRTRGTAASAVWSSFVVRAREFP